MNLPPAPLRHSSQLFFEAMAMLLLISNIGGLIFINERDITKTREAISARVSRVADESEAFLTSWVTQHKRATAFLAREGAIQGFRPSPQLQEQVRRVHALFPDFHNLYLADASATTVAFDPPVNERGESTIGLQFSDRPYFQTLKETQETVVSDVLMGRGGVFQPIFTISSPVMKNGELLGFSLGAVNLEKIERNLLQVSDLPRSISRLLTSGTRRSLPPTPKENSQA